RFQDALLEGANVGRIEFPGDPQVLLVERVDSRSHLPCDPRLAIDRTGMWRACFAIIHGTLARKPFCPIALSVGRKGRYEKNACINRHSAASSSGGRLWPSRRSTSSAASARLVPGPKIACTPAA